MRKQLSLLGGILAALAAFAGPASATSVLYTATGTGVGGAHLAASALFNFSGNTLTITLANTATSDNTSSNQDVPANTLTGLFFALEGNPTLTPISASIAPGALVQASTCNPGPCGGTTTNVGGEFRYATSIVGSVKIQGIASSGYIGGPSGNFGGVNLDNPDSPDGINFGIISNDPSFNPNGGVGGLNAEPLIRNQVVFVLNGVSGLGIKNLSPQVSFQYGTSLLDPHINGNPHTPPVPEPASLLFLGSGLVGIVAWQRRKSS